MVFPPAVSCRLMWRKTSPVALQCRLPAGSLPPVCCFPGVVHHIVFLNYRSLDFRYLAHRHLAYSVVMDDTEPRPWCHPDAQAAVATAASDPRLNLRHIGLLAYLAQLTRPDTGSADVATSVNTLADKLHEGRTVVEQTVTGLHDYGYITRHRRRAGAQFAGSLWTLHMPGVRT